MLIVKLKKIINKIRFRRKLKEMDNMWYFMGGSCFGLFPPSFYYTHTKEEIERRTAEEIEKLRELKKQLDCRQTDAHPKVVNFRTEKLRRRRKK